MRTKDEKEDELVTRSSAMVITWLRQNLKVEVRKALQEIYADAWRSVLEHLIRERWVKVLLGILSFVGLVTYYLEHK